MPGTQLYEEFSMSQFDTGQLGQSFEIEEGYQPYAGQPNIGGSERAFSVAAGLGLAAIGLARGRLSGLALTAMGAGLLWRGFTGRCQCYAALGLNTAAPKHNPAVGVSAQHGYKVEKTITINRRPGDLYQYWRRLENLPQVMSHLKQVQQIDTQRSHWVAEGALGKDVQWDAEIHNERENEMIAWRSLPGGDVDTAGSIHFKPSHNGGTEVRVSMKYNPPAGKLGAQVAALFGDDLEAKLDEDLDRFKQIMETSTTSTLGGLPPR
jgi:uncharacterized membrane protein